MSNLENKAIQLPVPCPQCGHETQETVGRLEQNPKITCAGCGGIIQVDFDDLRLAFKKYKDLVADFGKHLGKPR